MLGPIREPIQASNVNDVRALEAKLEQSAEVVNGRQSEMDVLRGLDRVMNGRPNPLARFTLQDVEKKWMEVQSAIVSRKERLVKEKESQEEDERVRISFAAQAKLFADSCTLLASRINAVDGEWEIQLQLLLPLGMEVEGLGRQLREVEVEDAKMMSRQIVENPHTEHTVQALFVMRDEVKDMFARKKSLADTKILAKKGTEISEDELREYQDEFQHFDAEKTGLLSKQSMALCLQSLGQYFTDVQLDDFFAKYDADHDGAINFEEFATYMRQRKQAAEKPEEIQEAFSTLSKGDTISEAAIRVALDAEMTEYILEKLKPFVVGEKAYDYRAFVKSVFG
jgi:Ca2+-binding EF-hand superfamily protein